jgi:PKD repeat protein
MSLSNLWRVLLITCFSFFISACKPLPEFSVSPTPVIVDQAALFDATASIISDKDAEEEEKDKKDKKKEKEKEKNKHKKTVTYNWNFGDGSTGTGITATHSFSAVGSYTVTLTVKDRDGEFGVVSKVIAVKPVLGLTSQLNVQVQGMDGVLINGAKVTIGSVTAATNGQGTTTLSASSGTQTVKVTKEGYVAQAVSTVLVAGKTGNIQLIMMPVKEVLTVNLNLTRTQLITASTLGAAIVLPVNALVVPGSTRAQDVTATGTVTLQLTPWDITNKDLYAMLGDGKAVGPNGSIINLISAGMMTVDFFNAAGQHLQLANGKTADIQMDLPYASINGQALAEGSAIPLWTFNEIQGLWIQEGTGTVVVSDNSPTGLAVKAAVGHFSTWNWDFWYTNPGAATNNINVICVDINQQAVACNVVADVTLPDGSKYYHHGGTINTTVAGTEGLTIYSVPVNANIIWTGTTQDGLFGTATGSTGTITIPMFTPTTNNFVQCKVAGVPVICDVELTAATTTANPFTATYHIPADGAPVKTYADPTAPLVWIGRSRITMVNNQLVRYEGNVTTDASGNAVLDLTNMVVFPGKTVYVSCDAFADVSPFTNSGSGGTGGTTTAYALDTCSVRVESFDLNTDGDTAVFNSIAVPVGTMVPVVLPVIPGTERVVLIDAFGSVSVPGLTNPVFVSGRVPSPVSTFRSLRLSELTDNQSILIRLSGGGSPPPV